jgi:hypothetical protein
VDGEVALNELAMFSKGEKALLNIFFNLYDYVKWSDTIQRLLRRMDDYLDIPLVQAVYDKEATYESFKRLTINECTDIPFKYFKNGFARCIAAIRDKDPASFTVFTRLTTMQEYGESEMSAYVTEAAANGRLDILQFLFDVEKRAKPDLHITIAAAKFGHFDCVKFLHQRGCDLNPTLIGESACKLGHMDMLLYAMEHGPKLNKNYMLAAIEYGHLHLVEMMRSRGIQFDNVCMGNALIHGQLDMIKLMVNTIRLTTRHLRIAISYGHLEIVKFIHGQLGHPELNKYDVVRATNSLAVLQYVVQNGGVVCQLALEKVITSNKPSAENMELFRYLLEMNCPYDKEKMLRLAIEHGNYDAYILLVDNQK